jgi:predicted helicase
VEVVDFIIRSADALLRKEFGRSLSDENIHILDPFTGTGTFITRLLQSGLIRPEDLTRKYTQELHANEIVLLAYYIAAINIENAFHDATPDPDDGIGKAKYIPFDGIVLTDTFQLGETDESEKLFSAMFPQNSERVLAQKKAPLRVIIGNPPYSVGQGSANDNSQNQRYEKLESRISKTYFDASKGTGKNSLYDSYIKAFRWASDRIDKKNGGIVAFITNGSWIDGNTTIGFRRCVEDEFSSVYVFNLRGNQRTSGELSRKEGGKIFGSGSRTPVSLTFLIYNPDSKKGKAEIKYFDIGDYKSREEKLSLMEKFASIASDEINWQIIRPNEEGDWINMRNDIFSTFIPIGDKSNSLSSFFVDLYSYGILSNRDSWVYNFGRKEVYSNIEKTIRFYNQERERFFKAKSIDNSIQVTDFITYDSKMITWDTRKLKGGLEKNKNIVFQGDDFRIAHYRPFCKQIHYFNKDLNHSLFSLPSYFPNIPHENRIICISGIAHTGDFSALISDANPDLQLVDKAQCFPLYYYEERAKAAPSLFDAANENEHIRRDGVSDFILAQARARYGERVSKEDIFYYVYGFLHSAEYRARFSADLKKMLPRLPLVESPKDFWVFSKAGRALADLHLGYDNFASAPKAEDIGVLVKGAESGHFRVEKMRFPSKDDKSRILYNSQITVENIPADAYEYQVNGKSAIEWVMERYAVTTHKDSGIKNDPNHWAEESGNPRYILDVLLSVIRLSVETVKVVRELPGLGL